FVAVAPAVAAPSHRVRVTVVTDSVGAMLRYDRRAQTLLGRRFVWQLELGECRRLVSTGCTVQGTAGPPPSALDTVRSLGRRVGKILVVFVGYNEDGSGYAHGIDQVVRAAVAAGARSVVWVTLGGRETAYTRYYHAMNHLIRAAQ